MVRRPNRPITHLGGGGVNHDPEAGIGAVGESDSFFSSETDGDEEEEEETMDGLNSDEIPVRILGQLTPYRLTFCQSVLRSHGHWKCLLLTLLIHSCSALLGWCHFSVRKVHIYLRDQALGTNEPVVHTTYYYQNTCDSGYIYIPVCFLIMFYLIYLIEAWNCPTRTLLLHAVDVTTALVTIKKLRRAVPLLWWRILCYHYVRRRRNGAPRYRGSGSGAHTSANMPHTYFERVNTRTRTASFDFCHCGCRDASQNVADLEDHSATLILFSKGFSFACTEAEREFEEQRATFFTESEAQDDYMETREGMELLDTNEPSHILVFSDLANRPWYLRNCCFLLLSFLLLSWPLRVFITHRTAVLHYHVHKVFGNLMAAGYTRPLPRDLTTTSSELHAYVRRNMILPPSYSEAMLLVRANEGNADGSGVIVGNLPADEQNGTYILNNESTVLANPGQRSRSAEDGRPNVVTPLGKVRRNTSDSFIVGSVTGTVNQPTRGNRHSSGPGMTGGPSHLLLTPSRMGRSFSLFANVSRLWNFRRTSRVESSTGTDEAILLNPLFKSNDDSQDKPVEQSS